MQKRENDKLPQNTEKAAEWVSSAAHY